MAGADQTTFLKQYSEFGLKIDVAGGVTDTVLMWNAGKETAQGVWTVIWWGDLDNAWTKNFVSKYRAKYGLPPENQAWGDYTSLKVLAEAIKMAGTTDSKKVVEALEKIKFDGGKGRELYYRTYDHQLMQPMYVVDIKKTGKQGQVGHLQRGGRGPGQGREPGSDRADQGRESLQHEARLMP